MAGKLAELEGLPVVDANPGDRLTLHVKPEDVTGSKSNDPAQCAAARAGQREHKVEMRVHLTRAYVKRGKKWVRYVMPESASREIVSFDRAHIFDQGTYTLLAPAPSSRNEYQREYRKTRRSNGKDQKRTPSSTPTPRAHRHITTLVREWKHRR